MIRQRNIKIVSSLMVAGLLLSGCNSKGNDDLNVTYVGKSLSPSPEPTVKSVLLSVAHTALQKDANTSVSIVVHDSLNNEKNVTDGITWIVTPQENIKLIDHTVIAQKDGNVTLQAKLDNKTSNPITLHIYWKVNNHTLPPEPDPKVNNATLLGVDVNHNGVRDDVERKVYATYKKAIDQAVMMQAFRTEQAMLADPDLVKHAREWEEKAWKAYSCKNYLADNNKMKYIKSKKLSKNIENWQFNTEKRVKKYFKYDRALSGGVFSIKDGILQDCEFDVDEVLEIDR